MLKTNILITGTGGCGVGEGVYKSLCQFEEYRLFSCNSSDNSLFLFNNAEDSFIVPVATTENYYKTIVNICRQHQINVIIPGSEHELLVLVNHRETFRKNGITILANTNTVINTFNNKWETFVALKSQSIKTPDSTLDIKDGDFFKRNSFPLVIKPVVGNASKNVFVVNHKAELECIANYLIMKNVPFVVQEHIGSADEEYTISVLSDFSGNYIGSIVFKRILAGGFSQYIECEKFPELDDIAQNIASKVNSKGPLNIQCRIMNGELYVFEINPRFSGTTSLRAMVGYNEPDVLLRRHLFQEEIPSHFRYDTGFITRGLSETAISPEMTSRVQFMT